MRLYIHGAGRAGRAAWPHQSEDDAVFVDCLPKATIAERVGEIARLAPFGPTDVIAHSLGAVSAVLAIHQKAVTAQRLVLLEPALHDLVRGDTHIEQHISTVTRGRQLSDAGDLRGFWKVVRPIFLQGTFDEDLWGEEQPLAQGLSQVPLPWGNITAEMIPAERTTVVTSNWNPEYEAIAAALAALGARHIHTTGARHRPQDHPHFEQAVFGLTHVQPR